MNTNTLYRRQWTGLPLVMLVLGILSAGPARAGCGADTAWLMLHSRFAGMSWKTAHARTVAVVDEAICALNPETVHLVGDGDINHAVFSSGDGLYTATVSWSPPFCPTGEAFMSVDAPVMLELSYTDATPFYAFDHPRYRADSLLVAVRDGTMGLRLHTVNPADGSVYGSETVSLDQTVATQRITAITGDGDSALVVLGEGGLVRRVAYGGTGWSAPESFDIDAAESATAFGDGFLGTASGGIYERHEGTFSEVARPASAAIRAVSAAGAAGDEGLVVVRSDDQWSSYTVGTASYRYFTLGRDRRGSIVELVDDSWKYSSYAYDDTPTRIGFTDPAITVNSYAPYPFEGGIETITIMLADPDLNHSVPSVVVRQWGGSSEDDASLTVDERGDTLRSRQPGASCELGAVHLESTELSITVDNHSVHLSTEAITGTYDFTCAACYWARREFTADAEWGMSDTLIVAVGSDTIRIVNASSPTGSVGRRVTASRWHPGARVTAGGRVAVRTGPNVREVRVYSAAGRLLASLPGYAGKPSVELPGHMVRAGMLYLRYLLQDGGTITYPLPMIR